MLVAHEQAGNEVLELESFWLSFCHAVEDLLVHLLHTSQRASGSRTSVEASKRSDRDGDQLWNSETKSRHAAKRDGSLELLPRGGRGFRDC